MDLGIVLAYIGPGAGLGAGGALAALVGAALLIAVGFVWYPARRLLRSWKARRAARQSVKQGPEQSPERSIDYV